MDPVLLFCIGLRLVLPPYSPAPSCLYRSPNLSVFSQTRSSFTLSNIFPSGHGRQAVESADNQTIQGRIDMIVDIAVQGGKEPVFLSIHLMSWSAHNKGRKRGGGGVIPRRQEAVDLRGLAPRKSTSACLFGPRLLIAGVCHESLSWWIVLKRASGPIVHAARSHRNCQKQWI